MDREGSARAAIRAWTAVSPSPLSFRGGGFVDAVLLALRVVPLEASPFRRTFVAIVIRSP